MKTKRKKTFKKLNQKRCLQNYFRRRNKLRKQRCFIFMYYICRVALYSHTSIAEPHLEGGVALKTFFMN